MDFALSDELEEFQKSVRDFLEAKGGTKVARQLIRGNTEMFNQTFEGLAELGATAATISDENDGLGLGTEALIPIFEELGRVLLPGTLLETLALAAPLIEKYGTEEQKKFYLPEIAAGTRTISLAWLEPNKDYGAGDVQCSAKVKGDSVVLNGEKEMVPDADAADTLLTVVRTSGVGGTEGISLLLVDVEDHLPMQLQSSFDETRHLARITFDEYDVPKGNLLGEINDGWKVLQEGLLHLNAALASMMTGSIDEIVATIAEYANIREQFGGPIGRFQAVKHPIVDMKMELESARSLSYYAAWALENDAEDKEAAIYSARSFATKAFIQAASDAIQLHGGIGFTEEIDCHLFLKRARFYEHYLGSEVDFNEHIATALGW